jgi:hypothetical protein
LRKPDTRVARVEDEEVSLEECKAVDEVQAFTRVIADVADDEVDGVSLAADSGVELYGATT